jgi:hypothetical protein
VKLSAEALNSLREFCKPRARWRWIIEVLARWPLFSFIPAIAEFRRLRSCYIQACFVEVVYSDNPPYDVVTHASGSDPSAPVFQEGAR